ncbi:restriction endonuclease-related protein [Actinacidiphila yanglinensis]|uniref:restriction endonuclease-related protein n=1 Tax=Actinacidiphila yanglinensis TaxID=310779 RepID=UPI000CDE6A85|nr:hypothetical protein [Actinacidiphila yanglinensis]
MVVSAAVRAGYAWSVRRSESRAWREIMSMTGVVNALRGAAVPALSPVEFVDRLSRPLKQLAPDVFGDDRLGWITVLEWDELRDDVHSDGCSVIVDLLAEGDRGRGWLPSWTWLQQEVVQNEAFTQIKTGATEETYVARRRFVIDNPVGGAGSLADLCSQAGIAPPVPYVPIPPDRLYDGHYWWPCPTCRWPMRVTGASVRCSYLPHNAAYFVRDSSGPTPRLRRRDETVPRQPGARRWVAAGEERTLCVELPVWRYMVVPGVEELALFTRWFGVSDLLDVALWPGQDAYDLRFEIASTNWTMALDLKDVASAGALADKVRSKPLAARTIVLPDHRGTAHQAELSDLLPGYEVLLVSDVHKAVGKALARARRSSR